ncbi:cell envelope integrity protein CreD [Dechloromonas sp. ARDL1]|uniref:cell envelope integrity protein CreD n=1 Tax=Dechloromonas sp. ARDL1 TaxID=3322121 RepID=UPI003DA75008
MDKKLLFKLAAIFFMSLLLLVPLGLIEGQIRERSQRQNEVQASIANSAAGEQLLVAPVIAVSYREQVDVAMPREGNPEQTTVRTRIVERTLLVPPEKLEMLGETAVETRNRGIYQARLFRLGLGTSGRFLLKPLAELPSGGRIVSARARLLLGIADPRGVNNDPEVTINGKMHRFASASSKNEPPATATAPDSTAAQAAPTNRLAIDLGPLDLQRESRFDFSFPLQLTGTTRLAIAPTGEANHIELKSAWPHPNFGGRFLPTARSVGKDGFTARWDISHLARNFEATQKPGSGEVLSIDFVDPVNVYLQSERAVKYGVLFIVLTFAGFFLTEILRRAPIHPMQYLLVGLALAIFFLLLIALSEHLSFVLAYAASAAACIGLIAFYLAGALGGARQGFAFGAGLSGLYGVLYGVLLSEDNSLLMGSLLLFLALGATMLATRRVDWYRLSGQISGPDQA